MDYDDLEIGMKLHCISEDFYGDVIELGGVSRLIVWDGVICQYQN